MGVWACARGGARFAAVLRARARQAAAGSVVHARARADEALRVGDVVPTREMAGISVHNSFVCT